MKLFAGTLLLLAAAATCRQPPSGNRPPGCIERMIERFESVPTAEPRREIMSYRYSGHTVYYVTVPCCDQMNELYDDSCRLLCHPDGGFTGRGDGRCPDFFEMRSDPVRIWKDVR